MDGMLSAAILILVFILVVAASGGSVVWFYRTSSLSFSHSQSQNEAAAGGEAPSADEVVPVTETALDAPVPRPEIENFERPVLALPAGAEPSGPGSGPPPGAGAHIYVLDSSRRSGR
jgi:hypothetical protein